MLYWVIARLARHGFNDLIINAHHFAEQIEAFAATYDGPGVSLTVSVEEEILDTGGGVRKAAWFFDREEPFLVHNVDVLTDLDLSALMTAHRASDASSASGTHSASGALATVAVKERKSSRHLLFDAAGRLGGWRSDITGETRTVRPMEGPVTPLPFMGVYAMSPAALSRMTEYRSLFDYRLLPGFGAHGRNRSGLSGRRSPVGGSRKRGPHRGGGGSVWNGLVRGFGQKDLKRGAPAVILRLYLSSSKHALTQRRY